MPKTPPASVSSQAGSETAAVAPDRASEKGVARSTVSAKAPGKPNTRPLETKAIPIGTGTAHVGNGSRFFTDWDLKAYRLGVSAEAASVDLKSLVRQELGEGELAFERPDLAYLTGVQGTLSSIEGGYAWTYEDENVKLVREVVSRGQEAYVDVNLKGEFKSARPSYAFVSLLLHGAADDPESADRQLLYWAGQTIERVTMEEAIEQQQVSLPTKWIGVSNRYFLMTMIGREGAPEAKALIQPTGPWSGRISLAYPITQNTFSIPLRAYFGPKELDTLRSVEPTLDHTVDFGWFTIVAYPLLKIMKGIHDWVGNWGVAIILLTILVRIAIFPLNYKSAKSMKRMSVVQPQLQKIREKYADDREALNREMLQVMRTHGVNPMAGCLPILIQMPVWLALYRVLYGAIELYHAPFAFWIQDLSAKDPYYVTPVLLTGLMYLQQKLMPMTATDPAQQKMLQFMPVIFGFMMISLPSGLTIYMVVSTLIGIVQQLFMNKKLGLAHAPAAVASAR